MYMLMVWVNDDPVTGNIQKLSTIVDPRKPFEDYKEGDKVKAKCQGFGQVEGVIGKIVYDEEGKKDLEMILKSDERFGMLVQNITGDEVPKNTNKTKKKSEKRSCAAEVMDKEKNLTEVAADLQLTNLEKELEKSVNCREPTYSDLISDTLNILNDYEPSPKAPRLEENVLRPQPTPIQHQPHHLEYRISQLESQVCWLWNQIQQMQCTINQLQKNNGPCAFGLPTEQQGNAQGSVEVYSSNESDLPPKSNQLQSTNQLQVTGGYTFEQLEMKIATFTEFSKASVLLFRLLFKEEEYRGKSLTGQKGKEALDQHKLAILNEVIMKKFPYTKPTQIRSVLSHIVKPSRSDRKK